MQLVAEASTGREAVEEFRTHRPDITLMDLQMPDMNGIEAIIAIRGEFPEARIIVLATIRAVHAGQKRIPAELASGLAEHTGEDQLSEREIEVLRLIAAGNANKEIAAQLDLAEDTVKRHVTNILSKLGANDRTHAVTIGLKRGIIEL